MKHLPVTENTRINDHFINHMLYDKTMGLLYFYYGKCEVQCAIAWKRPPPSGKYSHIMSCTLKPYYGCSP